MSYSADTFVADEQPTTAKWNKLWSNDASFNDGTGIADEAILARHFATGAIPPEKFDTHFAVGTINANASGSVTGLAFQPKIVEFIRHANTSVVVHAWGVSVDNGGSIASYGQGTTSSATGAAKSSTYSIINPTGNGTVNVEGRVTAFNADGFTFTMTTTANVDYVYIARG